MKLSSEQVAIIRNEVDKSKINIESLRDDVLDHLCCVVEIKMDRGKDFDVAAREALHELAPGGLDEIQRETIFLLNSTKIILMKKIMFSVGLLSSMLLALGWLFTILGYQGSFELTVYGFCAFSFIFLPMLAINYYKTNIHRALSEKLKFILGFISGVLVGMAGVFKMLHLQYGQYLLILGVLICVFGFLPFLFFSMYKKSIS